MWCGRLYFFSKTTFSNKCGGISFTDLWNNGLALQMTLWEKQANIRLAHLQWDKPTQYSIKYKFSVTCSYVHVNCLSIIKVNGFQAITLLQILHYREMYHELVNGFHLWCFWTIPELHSAQCHRMSSLPQSLLSENNAGNIVKRVHVIGMRPTLILSWQLKKNTILPTEIKLALL